MGTNIRYKRPDGGEATGYLASAAESGAPGLVVLQEWWGLQDQIKGVCDRLARAGFTALAPDLFRGAVVPYHDSDAAGRAMASLDFAEATEQMVGGAVNYLAANGAKVGLIGFCMGGAITVIGACRLKPLSAAVAFYGLPPEEVAPPSAIQVPFQAHFASRDDWCTPAVVDRFEAGLRAAGNKAEIFRYEADHAFLNEQRMTVHDRAAADLAWGRALTFLRETLRP